MADSKNDKNGDATNHHRDAHDGDPREGDAHESDPHEGAAHAAEPHAAEPHAHGAAHAHDAAHAHGAHAHTHKPNVKEYLVIFVVLAVLTALEVGVAKMPGISKKLMAVALIGLALTKAACVGLYYMHLKHESRVLKLTVAIPMAAPAIYALVLISEAAWRLTR